VEWFFAGLLVLMELAVTGFACLLAYRLYLRQRG
jgi:hypothetical protein